MGHGVRCGRVRLIAVAERTWAALGWWSGTWGLWDGRKEVAEWLSRWMSEPEASLSILPRKAG